MDKRKVYLLRIIAIVIAAAGVVACILYFVGRSKNRLEDSPTVGEVEYTEKAGEAGENKGKDTAPDAIIFGEEPTEDGETHQYVISEESVDWEDVPSSQPLVSGEYDNSRQVHFQFDSVKDTIYIGLGQSEPSDALYLNLKGDIRKPMGEKVGYYISVDAGTLDYSEEQEYIDWDKDSPSGGNYAFVQRYYTDCRAIDYVDAEHYGIRWRNDIWAGGREGQGTTIHVRALAPAHSRFLCAFDINIDYNAETKQYYIKSVTSADVISTEELNSARRTGAVEDAIAFAAEYLVDSNLGDDWQEPAFYGATVDKVVYPYFGNKFLNGAEDTKLRVNEPVSFFKTYSSCKDLFAVTLPVSNYGYITVYVAPWYQIYMPSSTQEFLMDRDTEDMKLTVLGYDPLFPNSEKTLQVPSTWNGDPNA